LALSILVPQGLVHAGAIGKEGVQALYEKIEPILDHPTPEDPFYLKSENKHRVDSGEAALYFPQAFASIADALQKVENWCEILPLHLNVKGCTYGKDGSSLTIYLGRKFYQTPDDAYQLSYKFSTVSDDNYFAAVAVADDGPLGTSDYHIEFEIIPVDDKTFGRIHVSDHQSWLSSKAMHIYLTTKGSDKQGIKVVGHDDKGNPIYSKAEAGVAERNLLRYYFAFAAFLDAEDLPEAQRHEAQLNYWFEETQKYPQLHEMDKQQYLKEKHKERRNQMALQRALH
jgi:hypothetical protein